MPSSWYSPPVRQGVQWGQGWNSPGVGRTTQGAYDFATRHGVDLPNLDPFWNYTTKTANPYLQDWKNDPTSGVWFNGAQNLAFQGLDPTQQYDEIARALWGGGTSSRSNPFQEFLAGQMGQHRSAWEAQEALSKLQPGYNATTTVSPSYAEFLGNRNITGTTAPQASYQGMKDTDVKNIIGLAQYNGIGDMAGMSQAQGEAVLGNILSEGLSAPAARALYSRMQGINAEFQRAVASVGANAAGNYFRFALQRLGILDNMGRAPTDPGYGT